MMDRTEDVVEHIRAEVEDDDCASAGIGNSVLGPAATTC